MKPHFRELWEELRHGSGGGDGWNTRRVYPGSPCPIFAALSGETSLPALLVEVHASAIPAIPEYPSGRGFDVTPLRVTSGRHGPVWLVLSLTGPQYAQVFETLADDVASAIASAVDERAGVRALLAQLRIWQEFMRQHGPEGLTTREQTGLFSELFFLRRHILPHLSAADAVRVWEGPYGGLHDFAAGHVSIEIKGAATAAATTFEASSLAQLDETQVGRLCLCHFTWHDGSAVGETLPELVESIRESLAAEDRTALARFNESLLRSGYVDSQAFLYGSRRLQEARELLFEVRDGFPRLRSLDVPAGIVDGSYAVELSACSGFAIDAESLTTLLVKDAP